MAETRLAHTAAEIDAAVEKGLLYTKKIKFQSLTDPTVDDDLSHGYEVGSWWFNNSSLEVFFCWDPAYGAASWVSFNGASGIIFDPTGTTLSATNVQDAIVELFLLTDSHNGLAGLQGGSSASGRWHLTEDEHDGLTDGDGTSLHTHFLAKMLPVFDVASFSMTPAAQTYEMGDTGTVTAAAWAFVGSRIPQSFSLEVESRDGTVVVLDSGADSAGGGAWSGSIAIDGDDSVLSSVWTFTLDGVGDDDSVFSDTERFYFGWSIYWGGDSSATGNDSAFVDSIAAQHSSVKISVAAAKTTYAFTGLSDEYLYFCVPDLIDYTNFRFYIGGFEVGFVHVASVASYTNASGATLTGIDVLRSPSKMNGSVTLTVA